MKPIEFGIYEALLDEELRDSIARRPELSTVFGKIDPEEQPARYAAFIAKVVEQALREEPDQERRLQHGDRNYTILFFARSEKKRNGCTLPFSFLGPADLVSCESEKPIEMVWRLRYEMPVEMFEENRRGG